MSINAQSEWRRGAVFANGVSPASEARDFGGREAGATVSDLGQQPRRACRLGAGEGREDARVGLLVQQGGDMGVRQVDLVSRPQILKGPRSRSAWLEMGRTLRSWAKRSTSSGRSRNTSSTQTRRRSEVGLSAYLPPAGHMGQDVRRGLHQPALRGVGMMTILDDLRASGRRAHRSRAWRQAAEALRAADSTERLDPEDLSMLAEAAFLSGDVTGCVQAHERAFTAHAARGAARPAARSALWIGQTLAMKGAQAAAGGWLGRAARMLDESGESDCAERGYLLMPAARAQYAAGRYADALEMARAAEEIGRRHGEDDLVAFAQHSQGRGLLRLERLDEGLAVLDQVFVEVFPGGLAAGMLTGLVACSVVAGCQEVGAYDRAAEWTAALSAWCDEQPELVQFSAECLVHRAGVLLRSGYWPGSLAEAGAAARCAERDGVAAMAAAAAYGQGEALRMLGRADEAERAYQDARHGGHDPMPGLARLRLQQDRGTAALSGLQRVLAMTDDPLHRAHLLPAAVEVHLATGTSDAAAADELTELALRWPTTGLRAAALHANGAVALAEGSAAAAAGSLRDAWDCWTSQRAPYEAAQARLLLRRACAALGDEDTAAAHREAAESALAALRGAATPSAAEPAPLLGLSPRETQVLGLVATGLTNRAVAERLVLSERTVDRHVGNILSKLGVSSRTAATAVAVRHGLA